MSCNNVPTNNPTILAADRTLATDTWATGLNNNMLVIGPSGAGKTRHVLKPNLMQMGSSFIVLDTKGLLCREMGPLLAEHGYRVESINFARLGGECPCCAVPVGYDPIDFIAFDDDGRPCGQDILSVAQAICSVEDARDPFWEHATANLLCCLIGYVVEKLPEEEHSMLSVIRLANALVEGQAHNLLDEVAVEDPASFCGSHYLRFKATQGAERMYASILGILAEKLMCFDFAEARELYASTGKVDFRRLGHEPVALFVTVSDVDQSLVPLTNLFLTQALIALTHEADAQRTGGLPVPVRLFLDDFGNLTIPGFAQTVSVIRSRNIWCTMLCQTTSQLERRYGRHGALEIIGNCDVQLVLAFQDVETAAHFREKANKPLSTLLATPRDRSWLFVRGEPACLVARYDVSSHSLYEEALHLEKTDGLWVVEEEDELPGDHEDWDDWDVPFPE